MFHLSVLVKQQSLQFAHFFPTRGYFPIFSLNRVVTHCLHNNQIKYNTQRSRYLHESQTTQWTNEHLKATTRGPGEGAVLSSNVNNLIRKINKSIKHSKITSFSNLTNNVMQLEHHIEKTTVTQTWNYGESCKLLQRRTYMLMHQNKIEMKWPAKFWLFYANLQPILLSGEPAALSSAPQEQSPANKNS